MKRSGKRSAGWIFVLPLAAALFWTLKPMPAGAQAQDSGGGVPQFAVDPAWPLQLPETWVWRQRDLPQSDVLGINADRRDHVWVTHRGLMAEYDPQGNLVQTWNPRGEDRRYSTIHGLYVDHNDFVWTTAREQHMVLKFTRDGQLVMTIGRFNETNGSDDPETMGRPAEVYVDEETNELFVADGYTNRRVVVYDAATGEYRRHWGAFGEPPFDGPRGEAPRLQFNVPHGITGSRDGLIYLADRTNSRVQVFDRSGTFVREGITREGTGGAFSVALSTDPAQEFVYVTDGTQHRIWILRRSTMEVVGQFSQAGDGPGEVGRPHNITVDSRGHIYVSEGSPPGTSLGQRAQKFVFQGMAGAQNWNR